MADYLKAKTGCLFKSKNFWLGDCSDCVVNRTWALITKKPKKTKECQVNEFLFKITKLIQKFLQKFITKNVFPLLFKLAPSFSGTFRQTWAFIRTWAFIWN